MIQEDVDNRTVAITVKTAKITGRLLAKAMLAFLRKVREPNVKHGKQSIKSLAKQGVCLTDVPIGSENIGSFNKIARKYNVDYALKQDKNETPPKWYVFFKAKDKDSIIAAFKEFSRPHLKDEPEKPSIMDSLDLKKELVSQNAPPVKNRNVGGHEL